MDVKIEAVWLISGGPMQERACLEVTRRGYKLILTDKDPQCVCRKYAHEFIGVDTFAIEENVNVARDLKTKYDVKAVFTAGADCHETVACVAKELKLPGINPRISHLCRYKHKTREALTKGGILQPLSRVARTLPEARKAALEIGFPVALKATNNSGSRGFSRINSQEELSAEVFTHTLSYGTTGYVIIEELLRPLENEIAEQSVETVWYNGRMYWLNWVDRLFRNDLKFFDPTLYQKYKDVSWAVEIGHINPAIHSIETKKKVEELLYRAGTAIGMEKEKGGHIVKADIMLTSKGIYILELTPRLSGGWDSSMTSIRRGANFIGGALSFALGERLDLPRWIEYFAYSHPNLFSSILAGVDKDARDCIGRKFAEGYSFERKESIQNAYHNLRRENYVSME